MITRTVYLASPQNGWFLSAGKNREENWTTTSDYREAAQFHYPGNAAAALKVYNTENHLCQFGNVVKVETTYELISPASL